MVNKLNNNRIKKNLSDWRKKYKLALPFLIGIACLPVALVIIFETMLTKYDSLGAGIAIGIVFFGIALSVWGFIRTKGQLRSALTWTFVLVVVSLYALVTYAFRDFGKHGWM